MVYRTDAGRWRLPRDAVTLKTVSLAVGRKKKKHSCGCGIPSMIRFRLTWTAAAVLLAAAIAFDHSPFGGVPILLGHRADVR